MPFSEEPDTGRFTETFVQEVRALILDRVAGKRLSDTQAQSLCSLAAGKMLRTRFAARLFWASREYERMALVQRACAATELVHTASLLHDDIIDNASIRRSQPTLWKMRGANYAVLMGDLLYCEALSMLLAEENRHIASRFVENVHEICVAEIKQELVCREKTPDVPTYVAMVRGKTGPLFGFLGRVCGGADAGLSAALEEAGYCTGTAYQLTDDLLDATGSEEAAGKTLGTDALRKKATLAGGLQQDGNEPLEPLIASAIKSAVTALEKWPGYQNGIAEFFAKDLGPVIRKTGAGTRLTEEAAA
jgi:geranylgeranyl pyrophosphate synthase